MGDDIINRTRVIKNLKIYGAVLILTASSYHFADRISKPDSDFVVTIEREHNIDNTRNYVLQGLTKVDDKYLLSAYDDQHNNSIIYVLNEDLSSFYSKELDTNSHVGGITYDPKNQNIWITDCDGNISAYDKNDLFNSKKRIESKYKDVYVGEGLRNFFGEVSCAYITYYDNKIYVGNYNTSDCSVIKEYCIKKDGMIDLEHYREFNLSHFVQGITFYEKDGKKYLITSSSFSEFLSSKLQVYDFDTLEKVKEIRTKKMMEEILIDGDKLITLYEANARMYRSNDDDKDIIVSDINKLLTK